MYKFEEMTAEEISAAMNATLEQMKDEEECEDED